MPMKVRYTVANGEIIAEKRNGVRRTYVPDPLGSTVALLDNNQQKTDTFSYWPYGEVKTRTGNTPTPFQYVGTLGYYRDSTGRTYVRARHYQQRYGRWMAVDPEWPDEKPYAYVDDNPALATDRTGTHRVNPCSCGLPLNPFSRLGQVSIDCSCSGVGVRFGILPEEGSAYWLDPKKCNKWLPSDAVVLPGGKVYKIHGSSCVLIWCAYDGCGRLTIYYATCCRNIYRWIGRCGPEPIDPFEFGRQRWPGDFFKGQP
jgi:RHS repeat-associated protein